MNSTRIPFRRLVVVMAEQVPVALLRDLAEDATECVAYHVAPEDEDRRGVWERYAARLAAAGYAVSADPADLARADLTVVEADAEGVRRVVEAFDRLPSEQAGTVLAIALGGGSAVPVAGEDGALGAPGALLLRSPWTPRGWVSEEICDHTSLLQLCERWTAERGNAVAAEVAGWRRALCGDLSDVIAPDHEVSGPLPSAPGRRPAHPAPYFPTADLRLGETGPVLRLGNIGPVARAAAPFTMHDGARTRRLIVPASPNDDQRHVRVPVDVREGGYDVTVHGPDHFHRRFAGRFPDAGVHCTEEHGDRDPWFPGLTLQVWHESTIPVFFWMQRRLGERAVSKAAGYGSGTLERLPGPRQTARFKEEPGANTFGWYDVSVTTSADPTWVREYAGHLPTGLRPTLGR